MTPELHCARCGTAFTPDATDDVVPMMVWRQGALVGEDRYAARCHYCGNNEPHETEAEYQAARVDGARTGT